MRAIRKYRSSRVHNAPKEQIVTMLFEEVLKRLAAIEVLLDEDSVAVWIPHAHHCRAIFLELTSALDPNASPELCQQLHQIYSWCISELNALPKDRNPAHIENIRQVTTSVLEGWREALNAERVAA